MTVTSQARQKQEPTAQLVIPRGDQGTTRVVQRLKPHAKGWNDLHCLLQISVVPELENPPQKDQTEQPSQNGTAKRDQLKATQPTN